MYKHNLLRRDVNRDDCVILLRRDVSGDVLMYRHAVSYRICVRDKHTFVSYNDTYDNKILYGRTNVPVHMIAMRDSVSYDGHTFILY